MLPRLISAAFRSLLLIFSIMSNPNLVQFFKNSNLVSQKAAEEIAATFSPKELSRHDFLFKEGRVCNDYYFLEEGFIRSFAHDTEGNDVTTNFYAANQVVFEVFSFFNRTISKENNRGRFKSRMAISGRLTSISLSAVTPSPHWQQTRYAPPDSQSIAIPSRTRLLSSARRIVVRFRSSISAWAGSEWG